MDITITANFYLHTSDVTIGFERSSYTVNEGDGTVTVCVVTDQTEEIQVTVISGVMTAEQFESALGIKLY